MNEIVPDVIKIARNPEIAELIRELTTRMRTKGCIGGIKCTDHQ
jgi:hypothetical protein